MYEYFWSRKAIFWEKLSQKYIENVQFSSPYRKAKVFCTKVDLEGTQNLVFHRFFFNVPVIALDETRYVVLYKLKFFFKRVIR